MEWEIKDQVREWGEPHGVGREDLRQKRVCLLILALTHCIILNMWLELLRPPMSLKGFKGDYLILV